MKAWMVWADHGYEGRMVYGIYLVESEAIAHKESSPLYSYYEITEIQFPCDDIQAAMDARYREPKPPPWWDGEKIK